jgi:hypothetical protein
MAVNITKKTMQIRNIRLALLLGVITTILSTYTWAVCYVSGDCTCAVVGTCYSSKVLPDCQVPTCVIADSSASILNVCPGAGPYTGRELIDYPSCCPSACRMFDSCTQQYVSLAGGFCSFIVGRWAGVGNYCR